MARGGERERERANKGVVAQMTCFEGQPYNAVIKAREKNVEHTSLERYWPKSPLPSRSSLHSSSDPTGSADPGRTLSFLSMRWKDISNRQLQTSSVTKIETFCFSLTPCPEPDVRFLTKPSVDACATFFCLDAMSLSSAYNRQPQKMFNGSSQAGMHKCFIITLQGMYFLRNHTSQKSRD